MLAKEQALSRQSLFSLGVWVSGAELGRTTVESDVILVYVEL